MDNIKLEKNLKLDREKKFRNKLLSQKEKRQEVRQKKDRKLDRKKTGSEMEIRQIARF